MTEQDVVYRRISTPPTAPLSRDFGVDITMKKWQNQYRAQPPVGNVCVQRRKACANLGSKAGRVRRNTPPRKPCVAEVESGELPLEEFLSTPTNS